MSHTRSHTHMHTHAAPGATLTRIHTCCPRAPTAPSDRKGTSVRIAPASLRGPSTACSPVSQRRQRSSLSRLGAARCGCSRQNCRVGATHRADTHAASEQITPSNAVLRFRKGTNRFLLFAPTGGTQRNICWLLQLALSVGCGPSMRDPSFLSEILCLSAMACSVRTHTSAKFAGSGICPVWGFISKTRSAVLFESGVPWHPCVQSL